MAAAIADWLAREVGDWPLAQDEGQNEVRPEGAESSSDE